MREIRAGAGRTARGFTLIELMIVIVIIGILVGFVLTASMAGVRRAEERATESLITKLDTGLSDRIESLLTLRALPTQVHQQLANIYSSSGQQYGLAYNTSGVVIGVSDPFAASVRAQVFAQYDMMRAEIPDVFYIPGQGDNDYDSTYSKLYPINFGAHIFPAGNSITDGSNPSNSLAVPLGAPFDANGLATIAILGENGASYSVAAGIYKNAGYAPKGYDGVNNDPTNNTLVDDSIEGGGLSPQLDPTNAKYSHKHSTARAEMLYAILVEGQGPLGSIFSADEFTTKEVQDTDGDGLPEFVDAWGQPLQFFRWPIYHHSDIQKGCFAPSDVSPYYTTFAYNGAIEAREQDPLDPNQQLVGPRWWSNANNALSSLTINGPTGPTTQSYSATAPCSAGAVAFQHFFHSLIDPNATGSSLNNWDRSPSYYQRRAFYTKYLIVSSGPDRTPGVFLYPDGTTLSVDMLMEEGKALPSNVVAPATPNALSPSYSFNQDPDGAWLDDISNHNLQAAGGMIQ